MAYSFTPGEPYYHSEQPRGTYDSFSGRFSWTEHSFAGATYNDGKADALQKVKEGLNLQNLNDKTTAWQLVNSHTSRAATALAQAYRDTFAAWEGDDADKAKKTFGHIVDSANASRDYSGTMHEGTAKIRDAVSTVLGVGSSGPNGWTEFGNGALGSNLFGDGDGGNAIPAYNALVAGVNEGRNKFPGQVEWQAKTSAQPGGQDPTGGDHNGSGTRGGPGGVSSPHVGSGSVPHTSTPTGTISDPGHLNHPNSTNTTTGTNPNGTNGTGTTTIPDGTYPGTDGTGAFPGGSGSGTGSYPGGSGAGLPGVDTGSNVSGVGDGSGLGGYGSLGGASGLGSGAGGGYGSAGGLGAGGGYGSAGGLGSGGVGSAGGAGFTGGTSGVAGVGAGGSGAGAGRGAGGVGTGGGGGGAAGRPGAPGMMPMRGGGSGNDSERERSTWLTEDEDVWGDDDAPPSVIT